MKILAFGEVLWDIYDDERYIGGAPLNFAAHLSMHGEDVYMISSVGNDELGKESIQNIKKLNINTEYISISNKWSTGKCFVTLDENTTPRYDLLCGVAYDYISSEKVEGDFDVLYFGTMALRSEYNISSLKELLVALVM